MIKYNIAYRYVSGEIEGFSGFAFSGKEQAKNDAIRKLKDKIKTIQSIGVRDEPNFDEANLVNTFKDCNKEEILQIKKHWEIYKMVFFFINYYYQFITFN